MLKLRHPVILYHVLSGELNFSQQYLDTINLPQRINILNKVFEHSGIL